MSDTASTEPERMAIYVPQGVIDDPRQVWAALDQVIGQNVRLYAHFKWHEVQSEEDMHPTERTVNYAQIQALLDYADLMDPTNVSVSEFLKVHFGWAIA